jgi:hypothetical protein
MEEEVVTPLGGLPLERYILSRWNDSILSGLETNARREQLAREFVGLGSMGRYVSRLIP